TLTGGVWANSGALNVTSSTLNLFGTSSNYGSVSNSGGTVNFYGTLNNTGNTLALTNTTGAWNYDGNLNGGTLSTSGAGQLLVQGGSFSGVTLSGTLSVGSSTSNVIL